MWYVYVSCSANYYYNVVSQSAVPYGICSGKSGLGSPV